MLLAAVIVAVLGWPRRPASAEQSFSATASAAGVRLTVAAQNAPLTSTPVDVGGPVAQARLDSLGTSEAFASFPYPGDLVVNLPGTASGFTGGKLHLPAYPFYVSSAYPLAPSASTAQGPYQLTAASQPARSSATANAGLNGGVAVTSLATSASVVRGPDGSVTAQSTSTTSPFAIGLLHLGTVQSSAAVTLHADGSTSRVSHLNISSITIGPVAIALTDKGFTVLNSTAPVPSLDALNAVLAPQHIHVAYVAARPTDHGVLSAALQITDAQTLPDVGASSLSYILGQDAADIQGALGPSTPPLVAVGASSPPPPAPVSFPGPAAPLSSTRVASAPPADVPPPATPLVRALPVVHTAAGGSGGLFSLFRFYAVLVAAALAVVGLALVWGRPQRAVADVTEGISPWTT